MIPKTKTKRSASPKAYMPLEAWASGPLVNAMRMATAADAMRMAATYPIATTPTLKSGFMALALNAELAGSRVLANASFQPWREKLLYAGRPSQGEPHGSRPRFDLEVEAEKRTAEPLDLDQRHGSRETFIGSRYLDRVTVGPRLDAAHLGAKGLEYRLLSLAQLGLGQCARDRYVSRHRDSFCSATRSSLRPGEPVGREGSPREQPSQYLRYRGKRCRHRSWPTSVLTGAIPRPVQWELRRRLRTWLGEPRSGRHPSPILRRIQRGRGYCPEDETRPRRDSLPYPQNE